MRRSLIALASLLTLVALLACTPVHHKGVSPSQPQHLSSKSQHSATHYLTPTHAAATTTKQPSSYRSTGTSRISPPIKSAKSTTPNTAPTPYSHSPKPTTPVGTPKKVLLVSKPGPVLVTTHPAKTAPAVPAPAITGSVGVVAVVSSDTKTSTGTPAHSTPAKSAPVAHLAWTGFNALYGVLLAIMLFAAAVVAYSFVGLIRYRRNLSAGPTGE